MGRPRKDARSPNGRGSAAPGGLWVPAFGDILEAHLRGPPARAARQAAVRPRDKRRRPGGLQDEALRHRRRVGRGSPRNARSLPSCHEVRDAGLKLGGALPPLPGIPPREVGPGAGVRRSALRLLRRRFHSKLRPIGRAHVCARSRDPPGRARRVLPGLAPVRRTSSRRSASVRARLRLSRCPFPRADIGCACAESPSSRRSASNGEACRGFASTPGPNLERPWPRDPDPRTRVRRLQDRGREVP